jgi:hypothetical protein
MVAPPGGPRGQRQAAMALSTGTTCLRNGGVGIKIGGEEDATRAMVLPDTTTNHAESAADFFLFTYVFYHSNTTSTT